MLKYELEFPIQEQITKYNNIKNKVNDTINELVETNWLNGLITRIYSIEPIFETKNYTVKYNINYIVFDDPNYIEEKERMEIGL